MARRRTPTSRTRHRREPALLRRGREFEAQEKAGWSQEAGDLLTFEKGRVDPSGRQGRADIFIEPDPEANNPTSDDVGVGIGEIKATDWDRVQLRNVRPLALRHARQVWRYIEASLAEGRSVCAGVIYPKPPKSSKKRQLVEEALAERLIQCVWRED